MSDIFRDYSFGGWLRHYRLEREIGLRELATAAKKDAAYVSNVETSRMNPPRSKDKVLELLKPLKLAKSQIDFMVSLALQDALASVRKDFK